MRTRLVPLTSLLRRGPGDVVVYAGWRLRRAIEPAAARLAREPADDPTAAVLPPAALAALPHRLAREFFAAGEDRAWIARRVPALARERTIAAAEATVASTFTFRGRAPVRFEGRIDWSLAPDGDVEWRWDLNRQAWLVDLLRAGWYTGDSRFTAEARRLVADWWAANPPRRGTFAWGNPFEVAFRANVWLWALGLLAASDALDEATAGVLLAGLAAHGGALDRDLELHVPNNHLLLEAKALAMLGVLVPELPGAEGWLRRGLRIVEREVERQVAPDGVHRERSVQYQRIVGGELAELLVALENAGRPLPPRLTGALARMAEFERWLLRPDGSFPRFGDASDEDPYYRLSASAAGPRFLAVAGLGQDPAALPAIAAPEDEATIWTLARPRLDALDALEARATPARALPSRAFAAGGFMVMRNDERALHLLFDAGPFGYRRLPVHGHADALSFELFAGEPAIVDPGGTGPMQPEPWRNHFRGTAAHNTVVVDGLDQSVLVGARHVGRTARTTLLRWASEPSFDHAEATHDGYRRTRDGVIHRRSIVAARAGWFVIRDHVAGDGEHTVESLLHFPPGSAVQAAGDAGALVTLPGGRGLGIAVAAAPAGDQAWDLDIAVGQRDPLRGWVNPTSGTIVPAPVLRFRARAATGPWDLVLVIAPGDAGPVAAEIGETPVEDANADGGPPSVALRVTVAGVATQLILGSQAALSGPADS